MKRICDRVIENSFYLLFFLVPLILTPWNYELFEFNKMMLTYFLTVIIVGAWLIKMVTEKRFIFRRTILDIPLVLFFISQLISTINSIDTHTSLWGYYSRYNGGLLSLIAFLCLYWALVTNLDKEKAWRTIRYGLLATALVALYGVAEHFGIDAQYWVQDVQRRVFSTLGQPNWLAAWLVALIPLTWSLVFLKKQFFFKKKSLFFTGSILFALFYLCLLYTKSRSGLMGFAIAYLTFWGLVGLINLKEIKKIIKPFIIINLILITITIFVGTPWTPHLKQAIERVKPAPAETTVSAEAELPLLITESGDIRKIVWQGAIDIWKHHPILGTGVETFAYSYYWHRPRAHNDISEWDFLYNKAHNEYLTILANTGLVGLLTYLYFIAMVILWSVKYIIKRKRERLLIIGLLAGYLSILVTNFFGFSVVAVNLLFFLMPALAIVLVSQKKVDQKEKRVELETKQTVATVIILFLTLLALFQLAKYWYADTRFALAEKFNNASWYEESYNEIQIALNLRPGEPYYHNEMALSLTGLATLEEDATLAAELAEMAVAESDLALKISPYHLNFWKKRAKIFIDLAVVDPQYLYNALEALLYAAELAPTDAKIYYNIAILYHNLDQTETAIETLNKTIELKPNYVQAHHKLAEYYQERGEIKKAREQLEYILEKIDRNDVKAKNKLNQL